MNDTLLRLADVGAYWPLWSDGVLVELENALAHRIGRAKAKRRVDAMRLAFPEATVTGYADLIGAMSCDEKDRHVLAAAVTSSAELLVTFNENFPAWTVEPYSITVVHPDDFLLDHLDLHPGKVRDVIVGQISSARRPRLTTAGLLDALRRSGLPKFAAAARNLDLPDVWSPL